MATAIPIFRIFDYPKTIEFYIDWLGFTIDWKSTIENFPLYMQVSLGDIRLHLSEHHGDCSPAARAHIEGFEDIRKFHASLLAKDYKFNRPGLEVAFYNPDILVMQVTDPFYNRITFTGPKN